MPRCPSCAAAMSRSIDAEDRPEPMQLRIALSAFERAIHKLACVQARLTIDNTADSWLTRLFTAEYAGLFDVFLPGLAAYRMPLPLGGTSNHFHTATLRSLGGWDPYNVTEDADLGIRLARAGLRTSDRSIDDLRGGAGASRRLDQAAHALVQGLSADLGGAYARSAQLWRELGPRRIFRVPDGDRRRGAGRAGAWRVFRRAGRPACVGAVLVGQGRARSM